MSSALLQLIFFVKFSSLIMITIGSSIVVALCFFMPALVLIGPEGTTGDLPFIGKFIAAITGGEPPADKEGGHEKLENSEPPKPLPYDPHKIKITKAFYGRKPDTIQPRRTGHEDPLARPTLPDSDGRWQGSAVICCAG